MALANEYCSALENASGMATPEFVRQMLRLLPRIYIAATDLVAEPIAALEEAYIDSRLDEDYYDAVRRNVGNVLGPDDTYLEVFEEDMKYSDTPIAVSLSEGLADLFQVFYNFLDAVRDMPQEITASMLVAVREDFCSYWSQILCNVLRALNHLYHASLAGDDDGVGDDGTDGDDDGYAD